MGLKKYKPKTAALRFTTLSDFEGISKKRPERKLIRIKKGQGGRNAHGRITVRHRGRRPQEVSAHRGFPAARQAGHPRQGAGDRIRSEPHGASGAAGVCGWREALYSCAERREGRRDAAGQPEGGAGGRKRPAAGGDSAGHVGPCGRAGAGRRRQDGAQRRHGGAHRRPRRGLCADQAALGRNPQDAQRSAMRRSARSATWSTKTSRWARPAASAGRASARPCAAWR